MLHHDFHEDWPLAVSLSQPSTHACPVNESFTGNHVVNMFPDPVGEMDRKYPVSEPVDQEWLDDYLNRVVSDDEVPF
jgi:hypothetical protein